MKEKKYYCLMLSDCYDIAYHYVSLGLHSVMKNVLRKEYTDLSTVKEDFMDLDDTITVEKDHWLVEGSFPVIATEVSEGIMVDCVSGLIIAAPDKAINNELIYVKRTKADPKMAELLLSLIDKESEERYYQEQVKLIDFCAAKYGEKTPVSLTRVRSKFGNKLMVGVVEMGDLKVSYETGTCLYPAKENTITKHLTYTHEGIKEEDILESGYINIARIPDFTFIKNESIKSYNNYIEENKDKTFKEISSKKKIKKPE